MSRFPSRMTFTRTFVAGLCIAGVAAFLIVGTASDTDSSRVGADGNLSALLPRAEAYRFTISEHTKLDGVYVNTYIDGAFTADCSMQNAVIPVSMYNEEAYEFRTVGGAWYSSVAGSGAWKKSEVAPFGADGDTTIVASVGLSPASDMCAWLSDFDLAVTGINADGTLEVDANAADQRGIARMNEPIEAILGKPQMEFTSSNPAWVKQLESLRFTARGGERLVIDVTKTDDPDLSGRITIEPSSFDSARTVAPTENVSVYGRDELRKSWPTPQEK